MVFLFFLTSCIFALEFNFESNSIPVYKDGELLENPFFGGFNKPKIRWIDWNFDGKEDLFILDEDGYIRYIENTSINNNISFSFIAANYFDIYAGSWFYINDFDSDGDFDLITQNSDDLASLSYYQNNNNTFIFVGTVNTQLGQQVYSDPVMTPTFADIDNDNDLDFFTCNYEGTVAFYENVGFNESQIPIFDLVTQAWQSISIIGPSQRHGASAINFIDLDGDLDLDLSWGDYFQQSLYIIWNIGNQEVPLMNSSNVNQQFPPNDPIISAGQNMPSFADLDEDGDYDLFITVLSGAYGNQWVNNFIYYENIGSSIAPYYEYRTSNFLDTIDLMINASPELFDIDSDGDLDLFIGTMVDPSSQPWSGRIHYYENVGNSTSPSFNFIDDEFLGSNLGTDLVLSFGNINGDEYADVAVGNANGYINLFFGLNNSNFQYIGEVPDIDLSGASYPELYDMNGDGFDELIIGDSMGNVHYYANVWQDDSNTIFNHITNNFILSENAYTAPAIFDINNDGYYDILLGSQLGNIAVYINDGSELINDESPFTYADTSYIFPYLGNYTHLAIESLRNINELDLIVGISTGGMYHLSSSFCMIGDMNFDSVIDILDVISIINVILNFEHVEHEVLCYSDMNADQELDILDVVLLVNNILD